jgi:hypothetical protein
VWWRQLGFASESATLAADQSLQNKWQLPHRKEIVLLLWECALWSIPNWVRKKLTQQSFNFKGHRFEKDIILLCVHWYQAYPLSQPGFQLFWASQVYAVLRSVLLRSLAATAFNADSLWRSRLPLSIQKKK